jgi:hypothetical protein
MAVLDLNVIGVGAEGCWKGGQLRGCGKEVAGSHCSEIGHGV